MCMHKWLIFIFDLVRKIIHVQNKPYTVTERSENTPGRVDSGRVDPGPSWLTGRFDFRPSWPATPRSTSGFTDIKIAIDFYHPVQP